MIPVNLLIAELLAKMRRAWSTNIEFLECRTIRLGWINIIVIVSDPLTTSNLALDDEVLKQVSSALHQLLNSLDQNGIVLPRDFLQQDQRICVRRQFRELHLAEISLCLRGCRKDILQGVHETGNIFNHPIKYLLLKNSPIRLLKQGSTVLSSTHGRSHHIVEAPR